MRKRRVRKSTVVQRKTSEALIELIKYDSKLQLKEFQNGQRTQYDLGRTVIVSFLGALIVGIITDITYKTNKPR